MQVFGGPLQVPPLQHTELGLEADVGGGPALEHADAAGGAASHISWTVAGRGRFGAWLHAERRVTGQAVV